MTLFAILGRRLLQILVTVVVVAVLVFFLMRLLPGDPAMVLAGERASDEALARARLAMRLDDPLLLQFWEFLRRTLTLQFGQSVTMRVSVTALIAERLPVTLMLTGMACLLALLMAVPLAFVAALRKGGWADAAIRLFAQLSVSMPVFYIGLVLLITLGAGLRWFPVGGIGTGFVENLYYLFLPALTLALSLAAILLRNLRDALIEVLHAEYIEFATAKGLPARLVLRRHVLRNAWVSTVTLLGLHIGTLVGGAVITETVFAIPGIGRLMIDSIFARDYAVVQGLTMVLAVMVSVVFLALDTVQAMLDPRVAG
ncbi:ABC transporter permease [Roseomonas haemaphysalidis]|uniref:ABC transporter permease n=1 Tax=Roseomonas haemaphysalidis TaxID=2768162 RepID=A0ABS3KPD1_9PROT|nr:ABC transporter permease [Roseomonas haemaphysalidis]MBO1078453.1 ABC transporter permease [Roseomonas haemaphysalidis]